MLKVVKKEEESYAGNDRQHIDDVIPVISEWLSCLLKAFEQEKGVAVDEREVSQVAKETRADTSLHNYVMFTSIQGKYE
jgi:hypothetical protein